MQTFFLTRWPYVCCFKDSEAPQHNGRDESGRRHDEPQRNPLGYTGNHESTKAKQVIRLPKRRAEFFGKNGNKGTIFVNLLFFVCLLTSSFPDPMSNFNKCASQFPSPQHLHMLGRVVFYRYQGSMWLNFLPTLAMIDHAQRQLLTIMYKSQGGNSQYQHGSPHVPLKPSAKRSATPEHMLNDQVHNVTSFTILFSKLSKSPLNRNVPRWALR